FNFDPCKIVRERRGAYLADCLVFALAYILAGEPGRLELASYNRWSALVRSNLIWHGHADPVETMSGNAGRAPDVERRLDVFVAWATELAHTVEWFDRPGGQALTTGELLARAEEKVLGDTLSNPLLHEAFLAVAAMQSMRSRIDVRRLGLWLA